MHLHPSNTKYCYNNHAILSINQFYSNTVVISNKNLNMYALVYNHSIICIRTIHSDPLRSRCVLSLCRTSSDLVHWCNTTISLQRTSPVATDKALQRHRAQSSQAASRCSDKRAVRATAHKARYESKRRFVRSRQLQERHSNHSSSALVFCCHLSVVTRRSFSCPKSL